MPQPTPPANLSQPGPSLRPLRIQLRQDDVLLFLHIPKTAGLSLIELLDSQFPVELIFPLHSAPTPDMFDVFSEKSLQSYRLVRGHFRFGPYAPGVYSHITQNPLIMTMLRHPVERLISAYHFVMRSTHNRLHAEFVSKGVTFQQYVSDPEYENLTENVLTRVVIGHICPNPKSLSDEAKAHLARQHLEQFAFVGIAERFAESINLLCHIFGWQLPAALPRVNVSPQAAKRDSLAADVLGYVTKKNHLDIALYEFAMNLFDMRLKQMALERSMSDQ
jgi:hypothetical protein